MPNVLSIYASPRGEQSDSRKLAKDLAKKVANGGQIVERDLTNTKLETVTATHIEAYYSPAEDRQPHHKEAIKLSDELVGELQAADIVIVGTPMYNFTVPGSLKLWIDLVARVGVTFKYGESGAIGLLNGKKAYFVITTGGTPIGGDYDYVSNYLKLFFGFVGITDTETVAAAQTMGNEQAVPEAKEKIAAIAA